jgi:hypothetical protein
MSSKKPKQHGEGEKERDFEPIEVLVTPRDDSQINIAEEMLIDQLWEAEPDDTQDNLLKEIPEAARTKEIPLESGQQTPQPQSCGKQGPIEETPPQEEHLEEMDEQGKLHDTRDIFLSIRFNIFYILLYVYFSII